jgi:hypothetical protein
MPPRGISPRDKPLAAVFLDSPIARAPPLTCIKGEFGRDSAAARPRVALRRTSKTVETRGKSTQQ